MRLFVDSRFASPYALSAFVALCEKAMTFELREVDLHAGAQRQPDYERISVTRRVPTLVDGDFSLSESSAIAEYLDDVVPGHRLYPSEPRARARARQVQAWLRSDLGALREERSTEVVFYGAKRPPLTAAGQAAADKLIAAASELLDHGGRYVCGTWSIADIDLAMMLNRLVIHGDPVPGPLVSYAALQWHRPSVREWVEHARPAL